jgi:hypothetical protein
LAAGAYGHDRWKAGASGCTYTFATSANVTTLTISAGSLIQVIEGLNLGSGTYTLSFSGTAQGKIGAGSFSGSGVTGAAVGGTNLNIEFNTGTLSLVQFEQGSTATPFERRPYGTELALCQRYFLLGPSGAAGRWNSSTAAEVAYSFRVEMRAAPTVTHLANYSAPNAGVANITVTATSISDTSNTMGTLLNLTGSGASAGGICIVRGNGAGFSAEL